MYTLSPNVASCAIGALRDSERQAVLAKLNAVRSRHGLPSVSYDASYDSVMAEAAMYMVANKTLTHSPGSGGLCYTNGAASTAGSSNLYMQWSSGNTESTSSASSIISYLIDQDVSTLGHRRWLLYPFLGPVSFGRVDGQPAGASNKYMASALKVMGNKASNVSSMSLDFVAYPYGDYPKAEFGKSWYLSFSALPSKSNANANGGSAVSYASASISVKNASGADMVVSSQSADYSGYGLPNFLQWQVAGLQDNVRYTVTISNVSVNGSTRQYQYDFTLQ